MKSLFVLVTVVSALMLFIGGCRQFEGNTELTEELNANESDGEEKGSVEVLLFFADPAAVDSGEEGEYGYVTPVIRTLESGDDLLLRTVEDLARGPREEEGSYYNTLSMTSGIIGVEVDEGTAIIDFTNEVLADSSGGTLGGSIFIQSIVMTATQFSHVEQVLVLVEGEPWCDGHVLWDEPLSREDLF